jgi:hypothetical protein
MRHPFITVFAVSLIFTQAAFAGDALSYKIADENGYLDYCGCNAVRSGYMRDGGRAREIAAHIMQKSFSPESVRSQFYQVNTMRGIIWQGDEIVQYDYKPLGKERFRHVLWVGSEGSNIVKLEIYDNENNLLFRGLDLEGSERYKFDLKKRNPLPEGGYFGFVNVHREKKGKDGERLLFTDGLSRFSVFRAPPHRGKRGTERLVVYGNYIYSVTTDNSSYTVVGSVPFSFMEDVVTKLDTNDEEFISLTGYIKTDSEDKK